MKYKRWSVAAEDSACRQALEAAGLGPLAAGVLAARGYRTGAEAIAFLQGTAGQLHDPFLMRDMDKAVARIAQAINQGEHIAVFGDYDVDGITATCLLTHYLRAQGATVTVHIPDRMEDGYGLSCPAIDSLVSQGVDLIITVDCGITAVGETAYATSLGVDVVITDHHACKEEIPPALAVVDPHRPDCPYPFKELAGVGVALKLVMALGGNVEHYIDLAAMGTVADVMTLTDENRTLVTRGLKKLSNTRRPGIAALLAAVGFEDKAVTAVTIGYTLAPRLNAAGRMEKASMGATLLLTEDVAEATALAEELCALNRQRQSIEGDIFAACIDLVEAENRPHRPALVLAGENWHQGVVGIVASRLTEKYACPVFMISLQEGKGKGSCRSFGGFHLFSALEHCSDLLEGYGGHALAAGFTILEEKIPAFRTRMEDWISAATGGTPMEGVLEVDWQMPDATLITPASLVDLGQLEPHGAGNPKPVLALMGCNLLFTIPVGGGRHMKLRIRHGESTFDCIFFSCTPDQLTVAVGDRIDVAFYPQRNDFRGACSVQLQVVDLRPAVTRAKSEQALYQRYRQGKSLTRREAAALIPSRTEFAGLWRYLQTCGGTLNEPAVQIARSVARTYHLRESYVRTMVGLEVLEERGLLTLERRSTTLHITLSAAESKVNLEDSTVMKQLRAVEQQ